MVAKAGLGGNDWECEISRGKLLYIRWMDKQQGPTVYSSGKYIHYPLINHNGKEYVYIYVCITESLCCTAEISTAL